MLALLTLLVLGFAFLAYWTVHDMKAILEGKEFRFGHR